MDWPKFVKRLLLVDARISETEAAMLRRAVLDGGVDRDEVKFLVHLKHAAVTVHPDYDKLLVEILRAVVLKDGVVSDTEVDWLREVLLADKHVSVIEREFVKQLRNEAKQLSPRFKKFEADLDSIRETDVWG